MTLNRFLLLCCPAGRLKSPGSAADQRCWIWQRFNVSLKDTPPKRTLSNAAASHRGSGKASSPAALNSKCTAVVYSERRQKEPSSSNDATCRRPLVFHDFSCDYITSSLSHLLPLQWFHCSQTRITSFNLWQKDTSTIKHRLRVKNASSFPGNGSQTQVWASPGITGSDRKTLCSFINAQKSRVQR